jgi:hypothetical protein
MHHSAVHYKIQNDCTIFMMASICRRGTLILMALRMHSLFRLNELLDIFIFNHLHDDSHAKLI